jgi:hypothetical protein
MLSNNYNKKLFIIKIKLLNIIIIIFLILVIYNDLNIILKYFIIHVIKYIILWLQLNPLNIVYNFSLIKNIFNNNHN